MPNRRKPQLSDLARWGVVAVALLAAAALVNVSSVLGQGAPTPGKAEVTDDGKTWPHEIKKPNEPATSMGDMLNAISAKAMAAHAGSSGTTKANLERVLLATRDCLAYDGRIPISAPPTPEQAHHGAFGALGPHAMAQQKVLTAYNWAFPQEPQQPDWAKCAEELEHGH